MSTLLGKAAVVAVATSAIGWGPLVAPPPTASASPVSHAETSAAAEDPLHVLVMGDSYSAGNGAGAYDKDRAARGCYRSSENYAERFADDIRMTRAGARVMVDDVACSGATTSDFFHKKSGRPPELDAVSAAYDTIFLSIGGNDAHFKDIVKYCLVAETRDGATCEPNLKRAEQLVRDGTLEDDVTGVLLAVAAKAAPSTKIVLVGYPFLEGDQSYRIRSGHGGSHFVKVGARLHELNDAADELARSAVARGNASRSHPTHPFVFKSVQSLFDGPPFHGLYAQRSNPDRWMVQPVTDASIATTATYYHPNPVGWRQEGDLLFHDPEIPHSSDRPQISWSTLPAANVGRYYYASLFDDQQDVGTWSVVDGTLPDGLRLEDGAITGAPTSADKRRFTLRFEGAGGQTAYRTVSVGYVTPKQLPALGVSPDAGPVGIAPVLRQPTSCPAARAGYTHSDISLSGSDSNGRYAGTGLDIPVDRRGRWAVVDDEGQKVSHTYPTMDDPSYVYRYHPGHYQLRGACQQFMEDRPGYNSPVVTAYYAPHALELDDPARRADVTVHEADGRRFVHVAPIDGCHGFGPTVHVWGMGGGMSQVHATFAVDGDGSWPAIDLPLDPDAAGDQVVHVACGNFDPAYSYQHDPYPSSGPSLEYEPVHVAL